MWTGDFIGTGEFTSTTVGDGVFTLTELEEDTVTKMVVYIFKPMLTLF